MPFPNINAAKAKYPLPADISLKKFALIAVDKYAPAKATKTPFIIKALYLIEQTPIPAVSTALGFSPTARNLKPKLVLNTIQKTSGTERYAK